MTFSNVSCCYMVRLMGHGSCILGHQSVFVRVSGSWPCHCLWPITHCQRITYKLCVLMHGVAFGYTQTYLQDAVVPLSTLPGRAHLRSADSGQYDVPRVSSSTCSRAFSVAGPQAWNQLPASLRHTNWVVTFKRHLKTVLFKAAYGAPDN